MMDTDSYLIKCTLEAIEAGVPTDEIQDKCECQMGFKVDHHNDNQHEDNIE